KCAAVAAIARSPWSVWRCSWCPLRIAANVLYVCFAFRPDQRTCALWRPDLLTLLPFVRRSCQASVGVFAGRSLAHSDHWTASPCPVTSLSPGGQVDERSELDFVTRKSHGNRARLSIRGGYAMSRRG